MEAKNDRVSIGGTKAKGRVRDVPLLMVPVVPFHRRTLEDKFRLRTGGTRTVYDLRRSFAFILEAAGIVGTRRCAYMGHGPGNTTALYELHDVAAYLSEDASKLREYIGVTEASPRLKLESGA